MSNGNERVMLRGGRNDGEVAEVAPYVKLFIVPFLKGKMIYGTPPDAHSAIGQLEYKRTALLENGMPVFQFERERLTDQPKVDENEDGGPAFPLYTDHVCIDEGMTLRDYFAAACLQSILRHRDNRFEPKDDAKWCYQVADEMIAERDK